MAFGRESCAYKLELGDAEVGDLYYEVLEQYTLGPSNTGDIYSFYYL